MYILPVVGLYNTWTLEWTGLDCGLESRLTALRALINLFHYNINVLPIYTHF